MNDKKRLNDKLLSDLAEQQTKILSSNVQSQGSNVADTEKITIITELSNYFNFDKFDAHETFEIPGVQLKNGKFIKIYVKEEDITKIADKADKYEKMLGIKFPAQIYQFQTKHLGETIPGTNTPIPRPKLISETNNQYEEYLKTIYTNEGISTKAAPDNIGRNPYPHEQINFKKTNKVNYDYYSEYYLNYQSAVRFNILRSQTPQSGEQRKPNNRIRPGEKLTIKDSELVEKTPLGQKIGRGLTTLGTTTSNPNFWTKFKATVGGLLIATGIGFVIFSNTAIAAGIAAGAIAVGSGLFFGKKIKNSFSRKINNWLYGKPIEATNDYEEGQGPTEGISQNYGKDYERTQFNVTQPPKPAQEQDHGRTQFGEPQPTKLSNDEEDDTKRYVIPHYANQNDKIIYEPYDPNEKVKIYPPEAAVTTSEPEEEENDITTYEGFINETAQNMKDLRDIQTRIKVSEEMLKNYEPESSEYLKILEELEFLEQRESELLSITETLVNDVIGTDEVVKGGINL